MFIAETVNQNDGDSYVQQRPAAQVSVNAAGANPAFTDTGGEFTLKFPDKRPGDQVEITFTYTGYITYIKQPIEAILASQSEQSRVVMYLVKPAERAEMASWIICNVLTQPAETRLIAERNSLPPVNISYQTKIGVRPELGTADLKRKELTEDETIANSIAETVSQRFANLREEETNDDFKSAMRLLVSGKVADALKVLDDTRLARSVEAAKKRNAAQSERNLAVAIQSYLLRGSVLATQFKFHEAEEAYRRACDAAPADFDAAYVTAIFYSNWANSGTDDQDDQAYKQSLTYFDRAILIAEKSKRADQVARAQFRKAGILQDHEQLREAGPLFDSALATFKDLVKRNEASYNPELARALSASATVLEARNDATSQAKAEEQFEDAIAIQRALAKKDVLTYQADFAGTLYHLALFCARQGRFEDAIKPFKEAERIYRTLALENPFKYKPILAKVLVSLGNLYSMQSKLVDLSSAHKYVIEALAIQYHLATLDQTRYLPDCAVTLNVLGAILQKEFKREAEEPYETAVAILRALPAQDASNRFQLASALDNLGSLEMVEGKDGARKKLDEAKGIAMDLVNADQTEPKHQRLLAGIWSNIGALAKGEGRDTDARDAFSQAMKQYGKIKRLRPDDNANMSMIQKQMDKLIHASDATKAQPLIGK